MRVKIKGFRDAMIIESVIEYGVNNKINNFVFVSFDPIFEHVAIAMEARAKGIELYLEKRVNDLDEKIFKLLDEILQETIKEREKRALTFLKTKEDEINEYLKTNFEISEYDISGLYGIPLSMLKVKLVNIESAVIEKKEDNKKGISFEAEVAVTMLVQSFNVGTPIVRKFKMGENVATEIYHKQYHIQSIDDIYKTSGMSSLMKPEEVEKTIKVKGEIEVEQIGDEYRNFKIVYIHPQQQSLGYWGPLYGNF